MEGQLFSALLPGKLNLLMRSAAATCLLQLARLFSTYPRSMLGLSVGWLID